MPIYNCSRLRKRETKISFKNTCCVINGEPPEGEGRLHRVKEFSYAKESTVQRKNWEKMYLPQRELARQRRILKSSKETIRRVDELLNEGSKLFESHGNIRKGKINAGRYQHSSSIFFFFFRKLNLAQRQICTRAIINR